MEKEYSVTQWLPSQNQNVMAYGHKTYCCSEDMEEEAAWHPVTFSFVLSQYTLKKEIPKDPEESILKSYECSELWKLNDDDEQPSHLIGVTKWKSNQTKTQN